MSASVSVRERVSDALTRTDSQAHDAAVLADIYAPTCNLAVWQRLLNKDVRHAIEQLFWATSKLNIRADVTPANVRALLEKQLPNNGANVAPLLADVEKLVDMFCCLFGLTQAGLRLSMLDIAMCPRFHVDHVPCRLVSTFRGAGSEWLPHAAVNREKLGHGSQGQPDEVSGLYAQPEDVRQLVVGDVALLKGSGWEGNEHAGLVHRSPQVRDGEKRLLLTLDFIG